jgi:ABC-type nitrate/sulfonate/bicarbonate transport system permease component
MGTDVDSRRRVAFGLLGVLPLLLFATIVELMGRAGISNTAITPLPTKVLERLWQIVTSGSFVEPLLSTSYLLFIAYFCASALAIATGILVGRSRFVFNLLHPLFELIRPLPKPALLPPLMLLLGIGDLMKIVIVGLAVFFPVLINTVQGVRGVDPVQIGVGRTFRVKPFMLVWKIVLPAALPFIFTGLRVGLGLALIVVVIAEMLAGTGGLGFVVIDMQRTFRVMDMYAWIIILAVFGYALNEIFLAIERRVVHWH